MLLSIALPDLQKLVIKQINNLFIVAKDEEEILNEMINEALTRAEHSFSFYNNKYYHKNGEAYFNPFHSGQYAIFLYFLSNSVFNHYPDSSALADRIYYLNKTLNAVDLFYEIQMPKIFFADHPLGSVMGRASYGDFFSFTQHCTVGNNHGIYPTIGKNVKMSPGATILGDSKIGDNVIVSVGACIKDTDIPSNSLVFGASPNLIIKPREKAYFKDPNVRYPKHQYTDE